jgi:mannose-1-phosphate guanylyltransferase/mannose-6-phosphate isomerase
MTDRTRDEESDGAAERTDPGRDETDFPSGVDYAVILAGGSGTRLWPLSREELPKQFLSLDGGPTLLQGTVERLGRVVPYGAIRLAGHPDFRALAVHQCSRFGDFEGRFYGEPSARNTAPAVAWACARLLREGAPEDSVVLVCPSDQVIEDGDAFARSVRSAASAARGGYLVTFGIVPTGPETGYGYIRTGGSLPEGPPSPVAPASPPAPSGSARFLPSCLSVSRFAEKPDRAAAEAYLAEGGYCWNGGIFCFRIDAMRAAMEACFPKGAALMAPEADPAELTRLFEFLPSVSIDKAVMEQWPRIACVPLDAGWSDVGSFDAIHSVSRKDPRGNVLQGNAKLLDGRDNLILASDRLVVGVDLESMILVDTPDALFVSPRGSSQKVREAVRILKEEGRREPLEAPESVRPWGTYRVVLQSDRYKIKRIVVRPGARVSLQYHLHRSEHWVVVRGTAEVTVEDSVRLIHEGESAFVPKSAHHRLANPGKIPLEILEVQCGEYLGEDDIVRLSDDFRRDEGRT